MNLQIPPRRRSPPCWRPSRLAAQAPAPAQTGAAARTAAGHVPRRSQSRRGGRLRHRREGQSGHGPDRRRLRGGRGRQAAEDHELLAASTSRSSAPSVRCSPRRRSSPTCRPTRALDGRIYLIVLDDLHTDVDADAARQGGASAVRRAELRRQRPGGGRLHERPRRRRPGLHQQPAPAARGDRQVHRPQDAVGDARADRRVRPDGGLRQTDAATRRTTSGPLKVLDPLDVERGVQARTTMTSLRKLADFLGGHPRPPQGDDLDQRRHRLRHLQRVRQHSSAPRHRRRDAPGDRGGDARQREHLRDRSPRPRRARATS